MVFLHLGHCTLSMDSGRPDNIIRFRRMGFKKEGFQKIYKWKKGLRGMADIKRSIPLATMERIMKKAGADRVSEGAKEALKQALEDYAEILSEKAWQLAKHAGRKTIKGEDIRFVSKQLG